MSDSIVDRISALQSEIGQERRRIEKLEAALHRIAKGCVDEWARSIARAALSTKEGKE